MSTTLSRGGTAAGSGLRWDGSGRNASQDRPANLSTRAVPITDPARILLVSLDNIGDLVFASALAPPLRARFPAARLDVWCKAYAADVAALIPDVSHVVASDPFWDRAPGTSKGRILPFLRAVRDIRRARYDLAVLLSPQWRVAAALAFARIPARIGRERRRNRYWLTTTLPPEDRTRPVVSELAGIARALGAEPPAEYRLDAAPLASRQASLRGALGTRPRVALHAFAGSRARCVAVSEWRTLAELLVRRGRAVVWIGARAELDEIRAGGASPDWYFADAVGDGSLRDAIALLGLCTAFVGHDSGPMHIASALGVPVVGIFAPGEPRRTFPQGPAPARVIARPSPAGITAEVILRELDALLPQPSPTAARR